jgi:hypothetical protein
MITTKIQIVQQVLAKQIPQPTGGGEPGRETIKSSDTTSNETNAIAVIAEVKSEAPNSMPFCLSFKIILLNNSLFYSRKWT